jgi:hypothetical protein
LIIWFEVDDGGIAGAVVVDRWTEAAAATEERTGLKDGLKDHIAMARVEIHSCTVFEFDEEPFYRRQFGDVEIEEKFNVF